MINSKTKVRYERSKAVATPAWKRVADILAAYLLLAVLYLPMIIISVAIRLSTGDSAIFRQIRVGAGGKKFVCYKFRTMRSDAPSELSTAEFSDAHIYITPIGAFLRRTSLDELPQLFNVIGGDMSIIGPRPLIPKENGMHKLRREMGSYDLRPGMTGLAQVSGRDMLSDKEKAAFDAEYAANVSFSLDAQILILTIFKVFSADGVGEYSGEAVKKTPIDK